MKPSDICTGLVIALAAAASAQAAPAPTPKGLCRAEERTLLSCAVARGRIISVCASKPVSATEGYIQYRIGRRGHLEMSYPEPLVPPKDAWRASENLWTNAEEARLRFRRGGFEYIISSFWQALPEYKIAGVAVRRDGREISRLKCEWPDVVMQPDDLPMVPTEPYDFDLKEWDSR